MFLSPERHYATEQFDVCRISTKTDVFLLSLSDVFLLTFRFCFDAAARSKIQAVGILIIVDWTYLEEISQPDDFRFGITDHFTHDDDVVTLVGFAGAWLYDKQRFLWIGRGGCEQAWNWSRSVGVIVLHRNATSAFGPTHCIWSNACVNATILPGRLSYNKFDAAFGVQGHSESAAGSQPQTITMPSNA
jgi:hypothetical protein